TSASLVPAQTVQLTATPKDSAANVISGSALGSRTATWTSSQPAVATVSTSGLVTGVAVGPSDVTATYPGSPASNPSTITVTQVPVASVTVSPGPTATVYVGSIYQRTFTALAKDAQGNPLPGRPVVWSSSDPAVATVDAGTGI